MTQWTDSFLSTLKNSESEITSAFDSIISVYDAFIYKEQKTAADKLWQYLEEQKLLTRTESAFEHTKLIFRARPKGTFDTNAIREYFHIPFSKRHLVSNQRFSVSGQPMLYFGSSVLTVSKELEKNPSELAVAAFLPSYSEYYHSKIFSLTNHIGDLLENALPGIFDAGSKISFDDSRFSPNATTIASEIHRTILMHVCTFPVEHRGSFSAEYVIPQMLTTALLEHGYEGIYFPSTKDFSDLSGNHRFSSHHFNLGMFVPYESDSYTNERLLGKFSYFIKNDSVPLNLSTADVIRKCEEIINITKKSNYNNNDYILPICKLQLHIEYMESSMLNGAKYFETNAGKIELELNMKMLCHLKSLIK